MSLKPKSHYCGVVVVAICVFLMSGQSSLADERMVMLATSGTWAAMEHRTSMMAAPDMCVAFETKSSVAMRSDGKDLEWRVLDNEWSLPTDVKGSIAIKVGDWSEEFLIGSNTSTMVSAPVPESSVDHMFAAMDKGSSMDVTVGKEKKIVSLIGSTKVTNAFRTCAGIFGAPETGNNPFK